MTFSSRGHPVVWEGDKGYTSNSSNGSKRSNSFEDFIYGWSLRTIGVPFLGETAFAFEEREP